MAPPRMVPGQPISFPAAEWNRHVEAADFYHRLKALGESRPRSSENRDSNTVNARNDSGDDRRKGEILEFSGSPLTDFSAGLVWLNGDQPQLTGGFGVLLAAAPAGKFEDCQVSGVCTALVNVTKEAHRFACPKRGASVLQSCGLSETAILYKPSGTGEKTCAIDLGGGLAALVGKPDAAIAKDASGTVSVFGGDAGSESDLGWDVPDCRNPGRHLFTGEWVRILANRGQPYVTPLSGAQAIPGITAAAISKGASGTINLTGGGTLSAKNIAADIGSGKSVLVELGSDGTYYIVLCECPLL